MTALQKLGAAVTLAAAGAETVVWAAADTPSRPGVQTAMTVVLGAIALGVGAGVALGAAFNVGRGEDTAAPAPSGIPPWGPESPAAVSPAARDRMRERPATQAPLPVRPADDPWQEGDVWDGTFTPEALAQIDEHRAQHPEVYPAEAAAAVTQVDMAPVEDTRQMPPVLPLPPWTPPVAPNVAAPVPVRVEVVHTLSGRHAAPERQRPDLVTSDWFRRAADRQESAV